MTHPHSDANSVLFDRPMLERLKAALAAAPGDRNAVFTFEGRQYVKGYAHYLIQYLDPILAFPSGSGPVRGMDHS